MTAEAAETVRPAEPPIPADARLVQIALGRAVFGVAVAGGRVVAAAPVAKIENKPVLGMDWREVASYYRSRRARFCEVRGTAGERRARAIELASALGHDIDDRPGRMDCRRCLRVALRRGFVPGTATEEPCQEPREWHLPPEDPGGGCKRPASEART